MESTEPGRAARYRARRAAAVLLVLGCAAGRTAAADDLDQLMSRFAGRPHGRASFVETQYLAVLKRPLESRGELFFDAPDRLEKRTLAPKPETLVVTKGLLTIARGNRRHEVALSAYPVLGPLIDSIRATLAGDRSALEAVYVLDYAAAGPGWTLALTPRDPKLASIVRRVAIAGEGDAIRSVETLRADGDRSLMRITPLADP
jgi:outer membrane lipoprotein-sorting protein